MAENAGMAETVAISDSHQKDKVHTCVKYILWIFFKRLTVSTGHLGSCCGTVLAWQRMWIWAFLHLRIKPMFAWNVNSRWPAGTYIPYVGFAVIVPAGTLVLRVRAGRRSPGPKSIRPGLIRLMLIIGK
jgi:hypothetical protein